MKIGNKVISKKVIYFVSVLAIIAVMFVPMLYSFIYLKAFWDPYGNLENVPVAFVNLDKSVVKDGKEYNIGKGVEDNLRTNKKVKWQFVSYDDAKKGVEGNDYYAMIVIPEDTSRKIAKSTDGKFEDLKIVFEANKGRNFIFSQISSRVADEIKNEVASKISEESSKLLIDNLYTAKNAIGKASNGTQKLSDGTLKLKNGSIQLSNGLGQALDGSKKLQNGLMQASNGENKIMLGYDSLTSGLIQFKNNLSQKDDRIPDLVNGASQVSNSLTQLKSGVSSGSNEMSQNLNAAADGIEEVSDNINKAKSLIALSENNLKSGNITEQDIQNIMTAKAIMDGISSKHIDTSIAKPLREKSNSMKPILDNISKIEDGAYKVSIGTAQMANGLNETQHKAIAGIDNLIAGVEQLKNGTNKISTGLNTATDKTGELFVGLDKLNGGAYALKNGLDDANKGTSQLNSGLSTGYTKMNDKLKFSSNSMSKFISNPVSIEEKNINDVKYYGEGLAPYFISLSLWLGAMFINLIISITKFTDIIKNQFLKSFTGKFIIGSLGVIVQALILSLALHKGLHMDTINISYFYLNNMLTGVVFFSIMYGLSCILGGMATPITFILLLLQLSSCGGTFPIEAAPHLYKVIGQFMPMTYSVKLIRMILSGINTQLFNHDMSIMIEFATSFLFIGFMFKTIKEVIRNKGLRTKQLEG